MHYEIIFAALRGLVLLGELGHALIQSLPSWHGSARAESNDGLSKARAIAREQTKYNQNTREWHELAQANVQSRAELCELFERWDGLAQNTA